MILSSEPLVLIVGAGPTGLMMACQLAMRGIPFRIIDQKSGPTDKSKALVLQARTLEILEQMGIITDALKQGQVATGINFIIKGRWVQHINLQGIGEGKSPYPYMYILEQSKTERLLLKFLEQYHIKVEWNTELVNLKQNETTVNCRLHYKDISEEEITVPWLIGADGSRSNVRKQLNIDFIGGTYEHTFLVADTQVDWDFNHQEVFLCLSESNLAAFFPMAGNRNFRVVSFIPNNLPSNEPDFNRIARSLEKELGFPLKFRQTNWFSTYRLHHRYARKFILGRCFLAGDAAHIHSPAGGQGMNTGLQDAYNLAWKLALVCQDAAPADLLQTYQSERLPVAKNLVATTDRLFKLMVSKNSLFKYARLYLLPLLLKKVFTANTFRTEAFKRISQIGISYRKSVLSVSAKQEQHFPEHAPKPGERVPYLDIYSPDNENKASIYTLLRSSYFSLLIFKSSFGENRAEELQDEIEEELLVYLPNLVKIQIIYPHPENHAAYELFGISEDAFYLIRPDNYIAYRAQPALADSLFSYLRQVLAPDN